MISKRWVLRRFRKTVSIGADVTSDGKLFQRRHPATGNARSPTVDSWVRRITSYNVFSRTLNPTESINQSTRLLNHYCSRCREQKQKIVNSYEGNDREKDGHWGDSEKQCWSWRDVRWQTVPKAAWVGCTSVTGDRRTGDNI